MNSCCFCSSTAADLTKLSFCIRAEGIDAKILPHELRLTNFNCITAGLSQAVCCKEIRHMPVD